MYVYNAAWLALAVVLTVVLGAASAWTLRRRGWRPALFLGGVTLLPMALYLTGTLRVVGVVIDQVAGYFVGFAFSPKVWLGVILGGVGLVLMASAAALKRRGIGAPSRRGVAGAPSAESIGATKPHRGAGAPKSDDLEDMDDINALLRKHGIQ